MQYEEKIQKLMPITGTLFLNEENKDHERIRIQQEIESTQSLKRKFGVKPETGISVPDVAASLIRNWNVEKKLVRIVAD